MSLWKIAWRSIQQRSLSSLLTSLSMALGVALVIAVLVIYGVVHNQFLRGAQGYHLIVGAKGGKLQLVLNTVYHLSQPIETIPYSLYKDFTEGRYAPFTETAIPVCLGDSYVQGDHAFRVVGTTSDLFDKIEYGRTSDGVPLRYEFAQGRNFQPEHFFEAVIGSVVASQTGLQVGDQFQPSHGIREDGEGERHDAFQIVGVLAPTGTPNDRALFVNMEGFYLLDGHAKPVEAAADAPAAEHAEHESHAGHDHPQPLPEAQRELTSILVVAKSDLYTDGIFTTINEGQVAQAVYPAREIIQLFDGIIGPLQTVLLALAALVVVVAGIGIMVAIYNSMSDRKHEIAVMRALGAGRTTVMAIILLESILLALSGGIAGILLGHGLIALVNPLVVQQTGVTLQFWQFEPQELILIPALVALAAIVGFLPAMVAYRTDVARALSANP